MHGYIHIVSDSQNTRSSNDVLSIDLWDVLAKYIILAIIYTFFINNQFLITKKRKSFSAASTQLAKACLLDPPYAASPMARASWIDAKN